MSTEARQQRMAAELESLKSMKQESSILDFEPLGNPPDRYTIMFRGRGICADISSRSDVEFVELHRIEVRLPYAYPERPPDLRWLTPIFHPNISFSGFITFKDIGLPWERDLGLDVICERLWDIARLAHVDLDRAANFAAKNWFVHKRQVDVPVDARPLRDKLPLPGSNVIRYERQGEQRVVLPPARKSDDILYIGEDTPTPQLPQRTAPPRRRKADDDNDVLYIGDD